MKIVSTALWMALVSCLFLLSVAQAQDTPLLVDQHNQEAKAKFAACIRTEQRWSSCYHHLGVSKNGSDVDESPYASLFEGSSKRLLGPWNPTSIDILRGSPTK